MGLFFVWSGRIMAKGDLTNMNSEILKKYMKAGTDQAGGKVPQRFIYVLSPFGHNPADFELTQLRASGVEIHIMDHFI